uniref:Uncharacterized protein n=1 Tax=Graphocephala atropunctata TaxID=36148 RepID=A0A1B6KNR5_9HEMI
MRILLLATLFLFKIPHLQTSMIMSCVLGKEKCPIDGGWTLWSLWGPCEGECGAVGRQVRTRTCTNPQPDTNGEDCEGESRQLKQCSVPGCNYEQYEKLLSLSPLRAQQLELLRDLSRSQSALLAKCLTGSCEFQDVSNVLAPSADAFWNALLCVKKNTGCPVSGGWGEWSAWTRCSAMCGEGQQMRCRVCCDPPPSSVGYGCRGDTCIYQTCTGADCKVAPGHKAEGVWSEWSEWSKCNPPCNFGITRRSRVCRKERQNQKRKSAYEDIQSLDYDYYDAYYDNSLNSYGSKKSSYYDPEVAEESQQIIRVVKRDDDKCDQNIEFYTAEDDEEEYSSSLPTSTSYRRETRSTLKKSTEVPNVESTLQAESLQLTSEELTEEAETESAYEIFHFDNDDFSKEESSTLEYKLISKRSTSSSNTESSRKTSKLQNNWRTQVIFKDNEECEDTFEEEHSEENTETTEAECTGELYNGGVLGKPGTATKGEFHEYHTTSITTAEITEETPKQTAKHETSSVKTCKTVTKKRILCSTSTDLSTTKFQTTTERRTSETKEMSPSTLFTTETSEVPSLSIKYTTSALTNSIPTENRSSFYTYHSTSLPLDEGTDFGNMSSTLYTTTSPPPDEDLDSGNISSTTFTTQGTSQSPDEDTYSGNMTDTQGISCDLRKVLQLPSPDSSFEVGDCSGPFEEVKPCNISFCNEDGGWSGWSSWSACSAECGLGKQMSERSCTNPQPRNKGGTCHGDYTWRQVCYLQPCPGGSVQGCADVIRE